MLDNVYNILKKRRKELLELKMLLGNKWKPEAGLDNLVFTNEFGSLIKHTTIQYYMTHIQNKIIKDGVEWELIHVLPNTKVNEMQKIANFI